MNHATAVTEIILGLISVLIILWSYLYFGERIIILNEVAKIDSEYEILCGKEPDNA